LSAKASKAVEGAGIPTSTTVVSITSTTDRHFPERGVIAHLCANLEIRAHRDARPIVLVDLSKDCHLVVDRLLIFCWPFCAQFEGGTPTAPENYLDLSYYQKALAGL
jgi:hypothetical protein